MQGATSKMSHNRTVILVVRPLWGRSNEDDLPPQVKTCGYANEPPLGSFLHLSLCPLGFAAFVVQRRKNRYIVPYWYVAGVP